MMTNQNTQHSTDVIDQKKLISDANTYLLKTKWEQYQVAHAKKKTFVAHDVLFSSLANISVGAVVGAGIGFSKSYTQARRQMYPHYCGWIFERKVLGRFPKSAGFPSSNPSILKICQSNREGLLKSSQDMFIRFGAITCAFMGVDIVLRYFRNKDDIVNKAIAGAFAGGTCSTFFSDAVKHRHGGAFNLGAKSATMLGVFAASSFHCLDKLNEQLDYRIIKEHISEMDKLTFEEELQLAQKKYNRMQSEISDIKR